MKFSLIILIGFSLALIDVGAANSNIDEIRKQKLSMNLTEGANIQIENLLPGEIAKTEVTHTAIAGEYSYTENLSNGYDNIFIFFKGNGVFKAGEQEFTIEPESIALAPAFDSVTVQVSSGDTLHYLNVKKKLSESDLKEIEQLPEGNRRDVYFKRFDDCKAYTEKIKSPNTISRTVLPKDIIPRTAMGTVQTFGPDEVGAHEHPMLDQLFFGLANNDAIVHADNRSVNFSEYELLHIPIGSSHWVTVDEGKDLYYQWMDFFITKEGQEWLKTHKEIENDDYPSKKD